MANATTVTRYYRWEGDACRIHTDARGTETADIYRGGRGIVPISSFDVTWGGVEIGYDAYRELVDEEDALHRSKAESSPKPKLVLLDGGRSRG